jgi:exopolysaccharide biosynthesis protein
MRSLGVYEALNFDGGGSSAFVRFGSLASRPSGSGERRVSTAFALV